MKNRGQAARGTRTGRVALGASIIGLVLAGAAIGQGATDAGARSPAPVVATIQESELDRSPQLLTPLQARERLVGSFVRDAGGLDLEGELTGWRSGAGERGTVVIMTSVTCPLCQRFAPAIARAEAHWSERGFGFVHVGVGGLDSLAELGEHARAQGLDGLVISDAREQLAAAFDVRTTTEVFVIDARGTLRYRGALSDQYGIGYALDAPRHDWLAEALTALEAGEGPDTIATTAPGCLVERDAPTRSATERGESITYARHISRLIQNNCLECHRTGGVAPFALEDHAAVARRASMLKAVIDLGTMPPWFASDAGAASDDEGAGGHNALWRNDRSLLDREVAELEAWIANGKPEGDTAELPLPRRFDTEGWAGGEPDAIYAIPEPFDVPAEGTVRYQYEAVPTGLERDRWVSGIEIRPGAVEVVHHVLVWALPAEAFEGGRFVRWDLLDERRGFFAAWAPGVTPVTYPEGQAKLLPAGSVLMFELHYTPNGREVTDRTSIGLRFASDDPAWRPDRVVRVAGISNRGIEIPAGAADHVERSSGVAARAIEVEAFLPHMHLRGAGFRYDLLSAAETPRTLLDVPEYDFNWQLRYELARPLRLERGDVVLVEARYDNSADNPANPAPNRPVGWGLQTDDEMMIGFVEYVLVEEDLTLPPDDPLLLSFEPRVVEQLRQLAEANGGSVPRERMNERFRPIFDMLDANGDGVVDGEEFRLLDAR